MQPLVGLLLDAESRLVRVWALELLKALHGERLGALGTSQLMTQALIFARSQLPGLRAVVYESPEHRDPLRDDFDLVATYLRPDDQDLYLQKLETMTWGLHATEAYLEAHGRPQSVDSLADHTIWLHYIPGDPLDHLPLAGGGEVAVRPVCATTNPQVVIHAVEEGLGLGFYPWQLAGTGAQTQTVLQDEVVRERALYMVAGLRERESPRIQLALQILDWLRVEWL